MFLPVFTLAAADAETSKVKVGFSALFSGCNVPQMPERVAVPVENCFADLKEVIFFESSIDENGRYTCIMTIRKGSDPDKLLHSIREALKKLALHLPPQMKYRDVELRKF